MTVYLIGSLRNPELPKIGEYIRSHGFEVFDDWFAAGPIADDSWRDYEMARNHTYMEGLKGWAAQHVFEFDFYHLNRCGAGILILPCGISGHLELGYLIGRGKPGYILLPKDKLPRWDVMYKFARGVYDSLDTLIQSMREDKI